MQRLRVGRHTSRYQHGQGLVEHIILWPALVILVLGTIQLTLLYRDKATLNDAVFRAAREGSLNNASVNAMNRAMVQGLIPLYLRQNPGVANYVRAEASAFLDNQIVPSSGRRIGNGPLRVEVITPTQAVFNSFATTMYELQSGCERNIRRVNRNNDRTQCREQRYRQIPNDNLNIRPSTQRNINMGGTTVRMNIQDANLLKIRGHWCSALTVPLMGAGFYHTWRRFSMWWNQNFWTFYNSKTTVRNHPHWNACVLKTTRNAVLNNRGLTSRKYYIPISSSAVVRMQSPVRM